MSISFRRCVSSASAAVLAVALSCTAVAQTLLGVVEGGGQLFEFSPSDGGVMELSRLQIAGVADIVRAPNGDLLGITLGASSRLFRFDSVDGSSVDVGPLGVTVFGGGLALSPSGELYGFSAGSAAASSFFRIDLATGAAFGLVPLPASTIITAAVFRSDGVLVGLDRNANALVAIDTTSGATTPLHPLPAMNLGTSGMTTSGGVTYFTRMLNDNWKELWTVDLYTGGATYLHHLPYTYSSFTSSVSGLVGDATTGTPFCFGHGAGAACPCGNGSFPQQRTGCMNSSMSGGTALRAIGTASVSADDLVLVGRQLLMGTALFYQGTSTVGGGLGTPFGDGLSCVGGSIVRLGTAAPVVGSAQYPEAGDAPVSVRGSVPAGATRHYQIWYRNPATYCTAAVFNLSNGLTITWGS